MADVTWQYMDPEQLTEYAALRTQDYLANQEMYTAMRVLAAQARKVINLTKIMTGDWTAIVELCQDMSQVADDRSEDLEAYLYKEKIVMQRIMNKLLGE